MERKKAMRVGIDARMVNHPGIGSYTKNLLENLLPQKGAEEYLLLGESSALSGYCKDGVSVREADFPIYGIKEQVLMPQAACGVDLLHVPHYNVPVFYKRKLVATVHDLIHLLFPEYLPSKAALFYAKFMYNAAAKKAVKLIAVSENTKKDLIKYLGVDEKKIVVTQEGVSRRFRRINDDALLDGARRRYALYKPFILCVSTMRQHKNIMNLVSAFLKLREERGVGEELVLVGRKDPKAREISGLISGLSSDSAVRYLGEVASADLPQIYNLAKIFVFPSLYEGFGLPVLEAFACGTAVAASNSSSIPEVAGDAARLFDPRSPKEMAGAIYDVLSDEGLRAQLAQKGFERIKLFDWRETARKTRQVYMDVLNC